MCILGDRGSMTLQALVLVRWGGLLINGLIALTSALTSDPQGIGTLGNYGVLGVFAVILVLFAKDAITRERERADRMEARLEAKDLATQDKVIPAILAATTAVQAATELLADIRHEREIEEVRRHPEVR